VIVGGLEVAGLVWANDERLLVGVHLKREGKFVPAGSFMIRTFDASSVRMLSVSVKGGDPVTLFGAEADILEDDPDLAHVIDLLPDDPQHVLMRGWDRRRGVYAIYKVDVYTGLVEQVERGGVSPTTGRRRTGGRF